MKKRNDKNSLTKLYPYLPIYLMYLLRQARFKSNPFKVRKLIASVRHVFDEWNDVIALFGLIKCLHSLSTQMKKSLTFSQFEHCQKSIIFTSEASNIYFRLGMEWFCLCDEMTCGQINRIAFAYIFEYFMYPRHYVILNQEN